MKKSLWLMAITALFVIAARADQLTLTDGSVINGKIIQMKDGKVKISTGFAGDLELDSSKIASCSTAESMNVKTADKQLQGKIDSMEGGKTAVNDTVINTADITTIWALGQMDPTIPVPKVAKWAYEVSFDVTGKTGNTEKTTVGGDFKATLDREDDTLVLFLGGKYAKENGVKNEEEIVGRIDYEKRFGDAFAPSAYARLEAERDKFNDYKLYYTAAVGAGYYFINDEDFKVRLRAGMTYVHKSYYSDLDNNGSMGIEFNYHHELNIKKFMNIENFGKFVTDITYSPTFDNFMDDYRILHESALDIPLTKSGLWSIRLGVSNEYNNRVAAGKDRMDTTYFGRLVISWN